MTMAKVRLAFVGCGGICRFHVDNLLRIGGIDCAGFLDKFHPEKALEMMALAGSGKAFADYTAMLDEIKPDALYICVPPNQHGFYELEAIKRGIAFYVEKPMALDISLAYTIRDAAEKEGIVTAVGFQDRYLDIITKMKEFLENRMVGLVNATWIGTVPDVRWWWSYASSGGQIVEQSIHLFDMLRYLFGEPAKVYCVGIKGTILREGYDIHDYSCATVTFKSNVIASVLTGCYQNGNNLNHNGLVIHCADADVRYTLRNCVEFDTNGSVQLYRSTSNQGIAADSTFLDAVRTGNPKLVKSPYADACKSLALVLKCNESLSSGKELIFV